MMWMSYHLIGFRSLSARRAWIEIARRSWKRISDLSLSARRAWIEIFLRATSDGKIEVALRKESVDRNFRRLWLRISVLDVALRKESVDRNNHVLNQYPDVDVALRKESVDRNIMSNSIIHKVLDVALRKESVDRNNAQVPKNDFSPVSLSARRAWIEII